MKQALAGIRILDLSRLLPGPFGTMLLGDLGAEVIKIEDPNGGDPARNAPPMLDGQGALFRQLNRNKKSVALNLKDPAGRDLFLRMSAQADVLLEQFRPGVAAQLGIDYKTIAGINPRIVYCSLSGYGQTGELRNRSGHDLNYLALSGLLGLATDERGRPVIPGTQMADLTGGLLAALAILAALLARQQTGRGQFLDVSMFDAALSLLPVAAAQHLAGAPLAVGDKHVLSGAYPFYNIYETSDGRYLTLCALEPKFWANFCRAVGRADWMSRQFDEGTRRQELFAGLRQLFRSRAQAEWVALLAGADCCCEPVLSLAEAFASTQAKAREMIIAGHQSGGRFEQLGFAFRMSDTPLRVRHQSPALGEHTKELLKDLGR